jgi:DNA-binding CsgD family transcriptional regulator
VALNFGWVLREEGDLEGAWSSFESGFRICRKSGEQATIAYVSLGLACLAADLRDWYRAATLHGVAQAYLDRSGGGWEGLERRYRQDSLAQVRAEVGDDLFGQAYASGMELSGDERLRLTLRAAGAASSRPPGVPSPLDQLSARERELLALVAQGHTDAQIADHLYISVSTVRSHLDRIRDKTGCRRRTELTRLALSAGLVEP